MVPNPIYDGDGDGPVYDNIRPQYETLVAVAPPRFTETHQASSVTESSRSNDQADMIRYVDQSVQLPQFKSQSFAHTTADIDGGSASRSYCNSVFLRTPRYRILMLQYRLHDLYIHDLDSYQAFPCNVIQIATLKCLTGPGDEASIYT